MFQQLPRRERELIEALMVGSPATAAELRNRLAAPPGNSTVRTLLARLERRGLISHQRLAKTYVYSLATAEAEVRTKAVDGFVATFFAGSAAQAALALLGRAQPSLEEIEALERLVEQARRNRGD